MSLIDFIRIFSEPVRIRILSALRYSPLTVGELVHVLELSQANVSHHLRMLKDAGLTEPVRTGTQNLHRLKENPHLEPEFQSVLDTLDHLIREVPETKRDFPRIVRILESRQQKPGNPALETWRQKQESTPYQDLLIRNGMPIGRSALDIGCGEGILADGLRESFAFAIGVDKDRNALLRSQEYPVVCADAQALPFKKDAFEAVFFRLSLQFMDDPAASLREACRVAHRVISILDFTDARDNFSPEEFASLIPENWQVIRFTELGEIFLAVLNPVRPQPPTPG